MIIKMTRISFEQTHLANLIFFKGSESNGFPQAQQINIFCVFFLFIAFKCFHYSNRNNDKVEEGNKHFVVFRVQIEMTTKRKVYVGELR